MPVPVLGNLVTPRNCQIQSAQGQVILNWGSSPLATLYYINRSIDNVTFTNIGNTTALNYNDSSGDVGSLYYYQVQAATDLISSPATSSLSGLSLAPGQTTLANIRLEVQQRTDRVNNSNISTQEWNSMISQSYKELYDILDQKFGDDYFVATPYSYTTANGQSLYPLPTDFKRLMGAEVALNSGNGVWVTMKQFQFIDRNRFNFYQQSFQNGYLADFRYRLSGNNLYAPNVPGGLTIRIWYVPKPDQLISDTDLVEGISGWEEYIVTDVAIKAMAKTEEDPTVFAAQKMALMKRIEDAATNRNLSEPQHVSDSRGRNDGYGDGSGGSTW